MTIQSHYKSLTNNSSIIAMKIFICAFALVAVAFAAPQVYNPKEIYPAGYTKEGLARIVSYEQDQREDGSYNFKYDTENGISAAEVNVPKPAAPDGHPAPSVQGGYRYTAPDGQVIERQYHAGEEGFVAEGADIPVAPPIPEEILRGLAWNAAHPEEEALWDPANAKYVGAPIYQGR